MNIIKHAATSAQPTTFKLEERTTGPDGTVTRTRIETARDREDGLAKLAERIRQNPDRYWGRVCRRLVLIGGDR